MVKCFGENHQIPYFMGISPIKYHKYPSKSHSESDLKGHLRALRLSYARTNAPFFKIIEHIHLTSYKRYNNSLGDSTCELD